MDPLWILLLGMTAVVSGVLFFRLPAFLALILGALIVSAITPPQAILKSALESKMSPEAAKKLSEEPAGERISRRFGATCGQIGILIAMASIVGKCMLESGAADRIVRSFLQVFGESRAPHAFLWSGFLLGIPVFFDTVFYLMIPLGKAAGMRRERNYLLYVLTIVAGATMTHSLVPPTPGPLFAANQLKVDLGLMMLGGIVVGIFTVIPGYFYACWVNRIRPVPLRESEDISLVELGELARRDERELPPLWLSLLPILLPVALIGGQTVFESLLPKARGSEQGSGSSSFFFVASFLGDKNIAMGIAAAIAMGVLSFRKNPERKRLRKAVEAALSGSGVIILITAAGGAFGGVLQETGIGARIKDLLTAHHLSLLPMAFGITALIRTAQGSATVAMITASGILAGIAEASQLEFHPLYLALAIGCGSKPIHWMNDSGFWVICKMSGLTEAETLRIVTPMTALMGVVGLLVTMVGARLFPLM